MLDANSEGIFKDQKQPDALKELFRCLVVSRKYFGLYGVDHPTTTAALKGLIAVLEEFLKSFEKATCIVTDKAVLVNGQPFESTDDSKELSVRLRDRGVMAFTFAGVVSIEEVTRFLVFLSTEPREIRDSGGPTAWLTDAGVTRIAVTEAVYSVGEGLDDGEIGESLSQELDSTAAAVVSWLCRRQDGPSVGIGHVSVADILQDPDAAARLITEAVTKLHASRKDRSPDELAAQVAEDLKHISGGGESAEWTKAAPLVRFALTRLAKELLPQNAATRNVRAAKAAGTNNVADAAKIDELAKNAAEDTENADWSKQLDSGFLGTLFNATPAGLLPAWRDELDPSNIIPASGRALELLVMWETDADDHARLSTSLAIMVTQAAAVNDWDSALHSVGALLAECRREDYATWRRSNAKAALGSVETSVMRSLVENALEGGEYKKRETVAYLVETLPAVALSVANLLGKYDNELFDRSLQSGIVGAGSSAIARLEDLVLRGAASTKPFAFELLAEISESAAVKVIAGAVEGNDAALAIFGLGRLPALGAPQSVELCLSALTHRDLGVRLAAIGALGEFGEDALPHLERLARQRSYRGEVVDVRVAAIRSLVRLGLTEVIPTLEQIAARVVLFGRKQYQPIKDEARMAIETVRSQDVLPRAA